MGTSPFISAGPFASGMDSLTSPLYTPNSNVVCAYNALNRGGIYQTRPGYSILYDANRNLEPRGATMFTPTSGDPIMIKVIGSQICYSKFPYGTWNVFSGITLDNTDEQVFFAECVYNLKTKADGSLTIIEPKKVLIIQTGTTRALYYDGINIRFLNPVTECPVGTIMAWVGSRLWVATGKTIHASNLLEPIKFTEEQNVAGGGFFTLPGTITGMGVTANLQSLLVFTHYTTTAFSASILDRTQWGATPDFQNIILPSIGCVAPKTVVNQYGMLWWLAEGGFINLNEALLAYRDSKIHYKDEAMARSKQNLADDPSKACAGAFGNLLFLSVPSGDTYNFHTWVMDNAVSEAGAESAAPAVWSSIWTGTRPVEWITATIKGHSRCFHLSRDRVSLSSAPSANMWEAFIGERADFGVDGSGNPTVTRIVSSLETKYLSQGGFCTYDYAEILMSEIARDVNIQGSYASRHSGYKLKLNKNIKADVNSLISGNIVGDDIRAYVRQRRRVRMSNGISQATDNDGAVEDRYTRNMDKGFSILVRWEGQAAIDYILLAIIPRDDVMNANDEKDELTSRYVDANGDNAILSFDLASPSYPRRMTSRFSPVSSRYSEEVYASL